MLLKGIVISNNKGDSVSFNQGEMKVRDSLMTTHTRTFQSISSSVKSLYIDDTVFIPQEFNLEIIDAFSKDIAVLNSEGILIMQIEYNSSTYFCDTVLNKSQLDTSCKNILILTFSQVSMFRRLKKYILTLDEVQSDVVYPYTYPMRLGLSPNTYSLSSLTVHNEGDRESPLAINIYGLSEDFIISLRSKDEIINSFKPNYTVQANIGDYCVLDSYYSEIKAYVNNIPTSISHLRDFNRRSFLSIPKGEQIIYFQNVAQAEVILYECYNNIR